MMLDTPVEIAGVALGNVLMNGAYIGSKTLQDMEALAQSRCGALVVGSISVEPRVANLGQGYWRHKEEFYSLNSFGMPGGGLPYFKLQLPAIVKLAHAHGKPLIVNVIGFSDGELVELIQLASDAGADLVELNFGCPNVWNGGVQKKILSYHADLVAATLAHIKRHVPQIPLGVKISPLPPDLLPEVAAAITDSGIVRFVTATNSYPNASTSTGTRTATDEALAGLSGRALKPIALGVVRQLRGLLPDDIDIIGCGGISSPSDARDYVQAGAKAVQIATALIDDGPAIFEKILSQAV